MADRTVRELPVVNTIGPTDVFLVDQGGQAKQVPGSLLTQYIDRNIVGVEIHSIAADQDAYGVYDQATGHLQLYIPRGSGIDSVTKTSTSGATDTYTILFENGETTTFRVTNGSSIQSIAKTSTSGLVDTYTITLTSGATTTFRVTNGRSITGIALVSGTHTPGTSDTYRISFNDNTNFDFAVYNGMDGVGAVSTINGISPDSSHNVALDADDIPYSGNISVYSQLNTLLTTLNNKQAQINTNGILKGSGSGIIGAAVKGTDYGAKSFTITLPAGTWTNDKYTANNANFIAEGYAYHVSPAYSSIEDFVAAEIYAEDVLTDGRMIFHCTNSPENSIVMNIVRMVSA